MWRPMVREMYTTHSYSNPIIVSYGNELFGMLNEKMCVIMMIWNVSCNVYY